MDVITQAYYSFFCNLPCNNTVLATYVSMHMIVRYLSILTVLLAIP